jgi:hypothetical protein
MSVELHELQMADAPEPTWKKPAEHMQLEFDRVHLLAISQVRQVEALEHSRQPAVLQG